MLRKIDRQFARIEQAAKDAPRPYHLVVLSDHGQSQGATFLERYGTSLEDVVREACATDSVHMDEGGSNEAAGYLGASLTEAGSAGQRRRPHDPRGDEEQAGRRCRTTRREISRRVRKDARSGAGRPDARTVGHGLGLPRAHLVPTRAGAAYARADRASLPSVVPALRDHPGIGFMLVRSERHGA